MKLQNNFPNNSLELEILDRGFTTIVGIDEVGRGAWAGPVFLGAYLFRHDTIVHSGVKDSKQLLPKKREQLFQLIGNTTNYELEIGDLELINRVGIGQTLNILIAKMLEKFKHQHVFFLLDGKFKQDFGPNTMQIIKGDTKHYSISAASVIAKVLRDQYMQNQAVEYAKWFFSENKGYGTSKHIEAIRRNGISPLHRLNFKPIIQLMHNEYKSKGETK